MEQWLNLKRKNITLWKKIVRSFSKQNVARWSDKRVFWRSFFTLLFALLVINIARRQHWKQRGQRLSIRCLLHEWSHYQLTERRCNCSGKKIKRHVSFMSNCTSCYNNCTFLIRLKQFYFTYELQRLVNLPEPSVYLTHIWSQSSPILRQLKNYPRNVKLKCKHKPCTHGGNRSHCWICW